MLRDKEEIETEEGAEQIGKLRRLQVRQMLKGRGQSKKLSGSQNPTQREKEFLTSDNQNTSR